MFDSAKHTIAADLCLYGNRDTGPGYLGCLWPHGQSFGTGEPVKDRTWTEAIWHGQDDIRRILAASGQVHGNVVRVFDAGGHRMATIGVHESVTYGSLTWQPAPVYALSIAELQAQREPSDGA